MSFLSKKPKVILIIILSVGAIVFFFFRSGFSQPGENILVSVARPFAKFFSSAGYWMGDKVSFFGSIGNLKTDNQKLIKENLEMKGKLARLKDIEKENENLRQEISLAEREKYELEAAFISGKDLLEKEEVVYIDKGEKDGIIEGMPVVIGKSVIIGKIKEVFHNQSKVQLLLSQDNNISVELESGEKGIAHGEYGTSVILDMVSQTAQMKNRDSIITSGLSEEIPRGLLVGYVKDPLPTSDQLFQRASVTLPYEMEKIRMVWVLKGEK